MPTLPTVLPAVSAMPIWKGSTTLSPAITSYPLLADRIKRQMGWPSVNVETCDDNIWDAVNQACEFYTKYAGYDQEYLIFRSTLYEHGLGIRLDKCFSLSPDFYQTYTDETSAILYTDSTATSGLSSMFDYDINNYRKVVDVFTIEQGETSGINTLFTLEQSMAQQVYSTFLIGNVGFDLVTWHILKDWLDNRSKMLAQQPHFRFNPDTQYLKIIPEPGPTDPWQTPGYYGLIGCYVERPLRTLLRERWVQKYALSLIKIQVAHVRGKYGGTTLFGGGTVNATDLMTQGTTERDALEKEIMESFGEVMPITFFVG